MSQFTEWFRDNGDVTHRLNYPLNAHSTVVDLGGYHGAWAESIARKFGCPIWVYEPVPAMMAICRQTLSRFPTVTLFEKAVDLHDGERHVNVCEDCTSMVKVGDGPRIAIKTISVENWLEEIPVSVDLLKINVEGMEFPILERLLELRALTRFKNIQVQFHEFAIDAVTRREAIRQGLEKTHHLTYDYEFVWENWRINEQA